MPMDFHHSDQLFALVAGITSFTIFYHQKLIFFEASQETWNTCGNGYLWQ